MATFFLCFLLFFTDCKTHEFIQSKCDVSQLKIIEKKLPNLTINEANQFLSFFSKECDDNAEFMEYSNEILFKLMYVQPEIFLKSFNIKGEKIDLTLILSQIENPIDDSIDLIKIRAKISKVKNSFEIKTQIESSLDKAIAKSR